MDEIPTLKNYVNWGIKGLKYSLVILIVIIIALSLIVLLSYDFSQTIELLIKTPSNFTDIFSVLQGVIVFIAIPIIIAIVLGMRRFNKKS